MALPILIANLLLVDAFFLVVPWLIVPLATVPQKSRLLYNGSLIALSCVLGPLLLIKGTLAIPVAFSISAAAFVVSRRSWIAAAALPCAALASIMLTWLTMDQRIQDLPYYFRRELYVASGYTDAMSLFGDQREIWIYLAGAAALLASQAVPTLRRAIAMPTLAAAAILFVAFKAGFVRHDLHASIAGGTLAMLGFLLFVYRGDVATGAGLLASIVAWLLIGAHYWPIDPASSWARMTGAIHDNLSAMRAAAINPDAFRRAFDDGKAKVAAAADLPPTAGTVDLYPNDQELLLASNRNYYPRPVMQSYSAYTPELAFLNADYLQGPHGPQTAFFDIAPIDEHYPAMDDGPTWPALLGQYKFRTLSQNYAVLDRIAGASAIAIDPPALSGSHSFREEIRVPEDMPFVWVRMQFHPTLSGRIASNLFKLPLLRIEVTTADGRTRSYRLVAGMASAGFLLSPVVASARDFIAMRSTATDVLADQRVTSVAVHQDGSHDLWGTRFDLQFSALRVLQDPTVDDVVLGHLEDGPQAGTLPSSGDCTMDSVGATSVDASAGRDAPIQITGHTVTVRGWGLRSAARGDDGGDLRIAVTPADGRTRYAPAVRQARPDVDAFFHLAKPTRAGFTAQVNLEGIDGPATLDIVQDGPTGPATCGPSTGITR